MREDLPLLAGLLAPLLWLATQDGWLLPRLLGCLLLVFGWQAVFARLRGQGIGLHGVAQALLIAALVPPGSPFWQIALGISFGLVLGEAIFGGRGRNFVQPVVLVLAFLAFAFTDQPWRSGPAFPLASVIPAALLLIASGQVRLAVLAGFALGMAPFIAGDLPLGLVLLVVLYLTADPVTSGATTASRLAYGALAGGLSGIFAASGPALGALVFASLLAQIFAPLLDHLAVAAHVAWMRRRQRRLHHG